MHKIETKQILVSILAPILITVLLVVTNLIAGVAYKPQIDFLYSTFYPNSQNKYGSNNYGYDSAANYEDNSITIDSTINQPSNKIIGDGHYFVKSKHISQYCELTNPDTDIRDWKEFMASWPDDCEQTRGTEQLYIYNPQTKTSQLVTYKQAQSFILNSKTNFEKNQINITNEYSQYSTNNIKVETKLCNNEICKSIDLSKVEVKLNPNQYKSAAHTNFLGWIER